MPVFCMVLVLRTDRVIEKRDKERKNYEIIIKIETYLCSFCEFCLPHFRIFLFCSCCTFRSSFYSGSVVILNDQILVYLAIQQHCC
jgi:hypothetical protein